MKGSTSESLPAGTIVAGYRIEREVGRGAMAIVYRAIQVNLQRPVALKVLTSDLAKDREYVVRFFNEARAAAALSHPHIIQAYDAGLAEGDVYYFAMEFVEGDTLLRRIEREGFLRPTLALSIASDIAGALDYGWQKQQLTHGDIKPENIMVDTAGQTKLADFGLAKVAEHDFEGDGVMLTPLYAAPEMIRGQGVKGDCRADIYSFGATLYHMLTGVPPFPGNDPREVMRRHLEETLTPPIERNPSVPHSVSDYVVSLLAKSLDERPANWQSVCKTLDWLRSRKVHKLAVAKGVSPGARSAEAKPGRRSLAPALWLLCLLLVASGVFVGARIRQARQAAAPTPVLPVTSGAGFPADPEWMQLKGTLPSIRDNPALCVRKLEEFAARYGENIPPEVSLLLEQFRRLAEKAAPAPTPGDGEASVEKRIAEVGVAVEQPQGQEREALLKQISALLREKGITPSQRQRLDSLRQKVESLTQGVPTSGAGASARTPEPEPPEPAPPATAPAAPTEADKARGLADAYVDLLAVVSAFDCGLDRSPEPLLREARRWLEQHPAPAPERERVAFLASTVLPAMEELLPKLVSHKARLVGQTVATRSYGKVLIKDIEANGLRLAAKAQYGETIFKCGWSELDRTTILGPMAKLAFGDADVSPADRRPYLAHLWLSRAFKQLDAALEALPQADPETRAWFALRVDLEQAPKEIRALAIWREAQEAYLRGEGAHAYARLQELKSEPSAVGLRYQPDIDKLGSKCADRVPSLRAARLVQDAREQLQLAPAEALGLCLVAEARYGLLDFPERSALVKLQEKALEALPATSLGGAASRPASHFYPALYLGDVRLAPVAAMALPRLVADDPQLPRGTTRQFPLFAGLAAIEAGDWTGAHKALMPESVVAVIDDAVTALQCSLGVGRGLVVDRFDGSPRLSSQALTKLQGLRTDDSLSPAMAALTAEFAILTHQFDLGSEPWPQWADLAARQSPEQMRRFVLAALTWLVEAGQADKAIARIASLTRNSNTLSSYGLSEAEGPILDAFAKYLQDGTGMPPPSSPPVEPIAERYVRLLLSCYASRPPQDPRFGVALLQSLRQISPGVGSIGATIWFDRLLLSLAAAIQEQDLAGAAELVSQGLDLYAPNLNAYYPRLCAMEAGVEILAGQPAAARETLGFVQWSAAASKSEQSWVRLFEKDEGWRRTPKELVTGSESHFWFAWLNWAFQVSQANEAEAEQQLAKTKGCRLSLAQKGFVETLRKATPERIKAETKRRTTPANQTGSVKPRAEGG